jgi:hypothetical protein
VRDRLQSHGSCHPLKAAAFRRNRPAPPVASLAKTISARVTCPLRFTGITLFQRYYGAVRPWLAHRYFRSRGASACAFSLIIASRFSSSVQKPGLGSRHLYTGHRMVSKQVASMLFPDQSAALVSMSSLNFR